MAFFERTDERDKLVFCNICNVKCAERSLTVHRIKCSARFKAKFDSGELERCAYDSGHIVKRGGMEDHLEFCSKRQNKLVNEFQEDCRFVEFEKAGALPELEPIQIRSAFVQEFDDADQEDWNKLAGTHKFVSQFSKMHLK